MYRRLHWGRWSSTCNCTRLIEDSTVVRQRLRLFDSALVGPAIADHPRIYRSHKECS